MHDHNHHNHEHDHHTMVKSENTTVEYIKFSVVILLIIIGAWLLNNEYGQDGMSLMRYFMGLFMATLATFKFVGYNMFAMMFAGYDVIAKRFKAYGYAYPFIEMGLGILFLFNLIPGVREMLTILVMGVSSIGVYQEIKKRSGVHCACLGNVIKLPLSTVSLIEDVSMVAMSAVVLALM